MNDNLPPHDVEAEGQALGCVMIANGNGPELLAQLSNSHFFGEQNREVFRGLTQIRHPNSIELKQWLRDHGPRDNAGGKDYREMLGIYIDAIEHDAASSENFPYHLETLQGFRIRRAALHDSAELALIANDRTIPVGAIADASKRMLEAHANGHGCSITPEDLTARQFDPDKKPPPLRAIYTLAGQPISTPGNLATITSAVKTGKSAVIGALAASAMAKGEPIDLLGFWAENPHGHALNWFDSEQSPDDFWNCVSRSIRRSGLQSPPPWLHAYCLTGMGHKRAWDCVQAAIKLGADKHGGTHSILLDGAADFIGDVNDPEESNDFVAELHGMAIDNDCPIIGVIHFNPGSDKSRGHLGSQLERKAETNLALEKDSTEATVIYSTKNRRAGIPKDCGPRFRFDTEMGMHVSCATRGETKDEAERERLLDLAEDLFSEHPAMRYGDLQTTVRTVLKVKDRWAEKKLARMKALTVIVKTVGGLYTINRTIGV